MSHWFITKINGCLFVSSHDWPSIHCCRFSSDGPFQPLFILTLLHLLTCFHIVWFCPVLTLFSAPSLLALWFKASAPLHGRNSQRYFVKSVLKVTIILLFSLLKCWNWRKTPTLRFFTENTLYSFYNLSLLPVLPQVYWLKLGKMSWAVFGAVTFQYYQQQLSVL